MEDDKKKEEADKGFVVKDRRFSAKREDTQAGEGGVEKETVKEEGPGEEEISGQEIPLPEINFANFLFSLHTSALIQLGEIQDPNTKESLKNLSLGKQTIDLIGMLKEKTQGNLTSEEDRMIEGILYDLRMRYVKASK